MGVTGPSVVREVLGARVARGADRALLATFHGVTKKAREFADQNSIEVLDALDLSRMAEES